VTETVLAGAGALLLILGGSLAGSLLIGRFLAATRADERNRFPEEVLAEVAQIRREFQSLDEHVEGVLDQVERKRRSIAGSASKIAAAEAMAVAPPEMTPEQRRAAIVRTSRGIA
jgi:biopolymer transport protein ExbB/TolQ